MSAVVADTAASEGRVAACSLVVSARFVAASDVAAIKSGLGLPEFGSTEGVSTGLLEIPAHLLKRWREVGADISGGGAPAGAVNENAYRDFVEAVLEFLRFKQVRLPVECRCDAVMIPSRSSPLALNRPMQPERASDDCIAMDSVERATKDSGFEKGIKGKLFFQKSRKVVRKMGHLHTYIVN